MTSNLQACAALKSDEKIQNDVNYVVGINAKVYNDLGRRAVVVKANLNRHKESDVKKQNCSNQIPGHKKFVVSEQNTSFFLFIVKLIFLFLYKPRFLLLALAVESDFFFVKLQFLNEARRTTRSLVGSEPHKLDPLLFFERA